jgi:hypothetical protein
VTRTALAERYAQRHEHARRRAAAGDPVVGVVGRDIPPLLVVAAGGVPFRIPPEPGDPTEAEEYLGRATDRAATAIAAAALAGRLDHLRGILVAHDTEGSLRLFYALRELHRRGRVAVPVHLVDQRHLDRPSTLRFNTAQLVAMVAATSTWTGRKATADAIAVAWDQQRELHAALAAVRDARVRPDGPDGLAALHAYGVASAAPDAGTPALIRTALETPGPRDGNSLPILLTGSAPLGDGLYRLIESSGAVVVGEDHDWGDPVLSDEPPATPPRSIEDAAGIAASARLVGLPAAASSSMRARAAATADAVRRTGARAVLSVVRPHDDAPAWDWSRQRDAAGVPAVLVRGDAAEDAAAIGAALRSLGAAA